MTWTEAKATPFADINELIGILNEWDRRRAQQQEQMRR